MRNTAWLLLIVLVTSCRSTDSTSNENKFKSSLKARDIGNTGLKLSIPDGYTILSKGGPDFMVYYLTVADSAKTPDYSGGIYLGKAPSEFPPTGEGCKTDSLQSSLLGASRTWKKLYCDSTYLVQTIIDYKEGKIHAFGKTMHEADIAKLLDIFATLK